RQLDVLLHIFMVMVWLAWLPTRIEAKGYSSGGHSYSSGGASSHSSSSGGSRSSGSSFGGGSSRSSGSSSGSKSSGFTSSSGKTYGSGSSSGNKSSSVSPSDRGSSKSFTSSGSGKSYSSGGNQKSSYNSGKSYSSGIDHSSSPFAASGKRTSSPGRPAKSSAVTSSSPASGPPAMSYDSGAARAMKEAASQRNFTEYKQSQAAKSPSSVPVNSSSRASGSDYAGPVPPVIPPSQRADYNPPATVTPSASRWGGNNYSGGYGRTTWYPDYQLYSTRPIRIRNYYSPYYSRPVVIYNDSYSSLFWWWLLDQPFEDRAQWVYHHRSDMDEARYRALVYQDLQLENRIQELEQRQIPADPNYVPAGMDRDLMYSDKYVDRAYATRPTHNGQIAFWFILIPTAVGVGGFFIWLVFFKRFQTATA
ncbi:MAG: hypothetical protein JWR69_2825, partial [Pedosphaera sp.]|nr:hypothetical protein [Pedosphaera sp.]